MTKKLLILVNPISGKRKALKILPFVKSFFDSNQIDYAWQIIFMIIDSKDIHLSYE